MRSSNAHPKRSVTNDQPAVPHKKPYITPKLTALTPDEGKKRLQSKGNPEDPRIRKLLSMTTQPGLLNGPRTPSLLLELKFTPPAKSTVPQLNVFAENLNSEHLPILRKYLQISEDTMREEDLADND
jgi:hypothetical protein